MAQIKLRGDKWYSDLRINGKRVQRSLSKYKPEAQRLLKEMVNVRSAQKHGEIVRDMSWAMFKEAYLDASKTQKKKKTFYADRRSFELIDAVTYITKINQMTPDRLDKVKIDLIKKEYEPAAIARGIRGMLTAMRWAEDRKYVAMQNWRIVKVREPKGRTDYYERDTYLELLLKLSKMEGPWFTSGLIMGCCGLRPGEMLHLEWKDVPQGKHFISFESKPNLGCSGCPDGSWTIKKDKELKKVRFVPLLTAEVRQYLDAIRKPSGYVLGPEVTRREDVYCRQFSAALGATGVRTHENILGYPYILRHTFGSHLAQFGVSLTKIAAWMGHESERMTECYRHLCPKDTVSDIIAVERLRSSFVSLPGKDIVSTLHPLSNSFQSATPLLSTLDLQNGDEDLSSKLPQNT